MAPPIAPPPLVTSRGGPRPPLRISACAVWVLRRDKGSVETGLNWKPREEGDSLGGGLKPRIQLPQGPSVYLNGEGPLGLPGQPAAIFVRSI
ncbi:hypothetical protein chiPu_0018111 [Chiloscyllium punctatum]|uniref:Uncharacterized protein n=1 Tax=Chiloscyllium punctatum TaxID=137246 RepID=A0A401RLD8_CHIPU|nr:hypothetical protein [Chiloscyllium punctatum]